MINTMKKKIRKKAISLLGKETNIAFTFSPFTLSKLSIADLGKIVNVEVNFPRP